MTMMGGRFPQGPDDVGQTVAEFTAYEKAQKAVSTLIAADVPARDIAIVGQGLRSVERVTGRLGYATAARSGAINGVLLGLLFSAILVIGSPSVPIQAFVGVLFVGIALGMLLSIITYSFVRRRRDFASVTQVVADRYEVTVAASSVQRARQVLGPVSPPAAPVAPAPAATPAPVDDRPQYGQRVDPDEAKTAPDDADDSADRASGSDGPDADAGATSGAATQAHATEDSPSDTARDEAPRAARPDAAA
ncbi:general stress protein [Microbacterium sp.]|uniref:general stress protein n=1 Tax=Microbacterium sp. TaxID=51671 RepID=UPI003F71C008